MTQQLATELVPQWTLGDRLRKARELTGLDAVEFAEAIHVHRDTVANYEKDKLTRPRLMVLDAWARFTGVSMHWLETGRNPHPARPDGGCEECAIRDSNPEPADSLRGRWFGRTGERRGFMPIADPGGRPHRRRRLVVPLAGGQAAARFRIVDNVVAELPHPRRAAEQAAASLGMAA